MSLATVQENNRAANAASGGDEGARAGGMRASSVGFSRRQNPAAPVAEKGEGGKVFSMAKVKDDGFKSLDRQKRGSTKFEKFLRNSTVIDKFLHQSVDYVRSVLKADGMLGEVKTVEEEKKASQTPSSKKKAHVRKPEDEREVALRLREMGSTYANIILSESNYQQWRQEQIFYEAFYELSVYVVNAYLENKFEHQVEEEMGRIFRTEAFNFSKSKQDASTKSVLSARELYSLRYEGDSYSNGRILATLHPRNRDQSVHRYLKAHSPIIATILPDESEVAGRAGGDGAPVGDTEHIDGAMMTGTIMSGTIAEDAGSTPGPQIENEPNAGQNEVLENVQ